MQDNKFLQKYVDNKLENMKSLPDAVSDYLSLYLDDYVDDNYPFDIKILHKLGCDPLFFTNKFNPDEKQIRLAVQKSKVLNILMERYEKAIIQHIPEIIHLDILSLDKEEIRDKLEPSDYKIKQSAQEKLRKAKLTNAEKRAVGLL